MKPQKQQSKKKGTPERPSLSKKNLDPALSSTNKWLIITGLIAYTFILYGNSISHDYALDDDIITRKNEFVQQGVSGIGSIFSKGFLYGFNRANDQSYRPITLTSIAIEKQVWGNDPHVHHFFNVFWYAVTVVFLFLLLLKLFRKYHFIIPLLITLLFASHPIHTEVVANIKSRDEILSFLFCVLALYFSLQYYSYNKPKYYEFLSWIFFFIAILSKETVLMFVVIIPMVYYFFTDFSFKKIIILSIPFALLVVIYMLLRGHILDSITFNEKMKVINNGLMAAQSNGDRLATTIYVLGKYIWLLFVPLTLSWDYSYAQIPIVSLASPQAIISIVIYAGLIVFALLGLKRKDPISFGILYYIITMALVSNLVVKIGSSMGERFLYTSSLGFCIVVVILIFRLLKISTTGYVFSKRTTIYAVFGVILLGYSVKTVARNSVWENNSTLFASGVITTPNSARAHESLANELMNEGIDASNNNDRTELFAKAKSEFDTALKILPQYSEAWYNEGYMFLQMGNNEASKKAFLQCLVVDSGYVAAYNNLGTLYFNEKQYDAALPYFEKSVKIDSTFSMAYGNIGACYHNMGQYEKAIQFYEKALKLNPDMDDVKQNLIKAQNSLGQKN